MHGMRCEYTTDRSTARQPQRNVMTECEELGLLIKSGLSRKQGTARAASRWHRVLQNLQKKRKFQKFQKFRKFRKIEKSEKFGKISENFGIEKIAFSNISKIFQNFRSRLRKKKSCSEKNFQLFLFFYKISKFLKILKVEVLVVIKTNARIRHRQAK